MQPSFEGLFINEIMASNQATIEDSEGEFDDWIELYNDGDVPLNVGGLFLSDKVENPSMFRITTAYPDSTTILPKGHLLIWADDSTEQGILHTNFKLDGSGEAVIVCSASAEAILDSLSFGLQSQDISLGRSSDGAMAITPQIPTPGVSNLTFSYDGIIISEVMASDHSGIKDDFGEYEDWIELYNSSDSAIDIAGMVLSDSLGQTNQGFIPGGHPEVTSIEPNDYLVLWADDSIEQGPLHLAFGLRESGEQVGLYTLDGRLLDSLSYPNQYNDFSYSKFDQGIWLSGPPTPGVSNLTFSYNGIIISEVMASDHSGIKDDFGEYEDWIELYNSSDSAIDIAGMVLSDSLGQTNQGFIPGGHPEVTSIEPNDYLVLWADDSIEQGPLHLAFGLRESGEQVGLYTLDGRLLDSLSYPNQYNDFSYSKLDQGLWLSVPPTPGEKNVVNSISNLHINEYMSDNENRLMDEFAEYDDWIEIYNDNTFPVNLAGLYLSDSLPQANMYRIPSNDYELTLVPAKGYVIIWTDGNSEQGPLHTNFKLSKSGEELVLSAYDYRQTIDSISYGKQYSNFSSGRLNGQGPWFNLPPTPGMPNIRPDLSFLSINEIMPYNSGVVADNHGEYDDWIEFYNGGTEAIDLGGLFISDSLGDPYPFRISSDQPDSTTIQPMQFLLIWADDSSGQGILHCDFKLSRAGEQVVLYSYDGLALVDSITYSLVPRRSTYGRIIDGDLPWMELGIPTPLGYNITTGKEKSQVYPAGFSYEIYPNPASDHVIISLGVSKATEVLIKLYDPTGKLLALPVDGFFTEGDYTISCSLVDSNGLPLGAGLYFYVIETQEAIESGKLIIINHH